MEKRYALLIDAENADIKYLDNILNEIKTYGNVTYKRMYGDFTSSNMKEWNERALEYAIVPIQQPHYTKSKNAADIMLVIDAMDILYGKNVDGFCIVSNDSDYTRLVNRLCEAGMEVIGMGSSHASKTLKAACTEFKNLEKIFSEELEEKQVKPKKTGSSKEEKSDSIASIEEIKGTIEELIMKNERAGLGGIKSTLQRRYSDFDERNYGFTTIRKLVESMKDFQIIQENSSLYVEMSKPKYDEGVVSGYIRELLAAGEMEMGALSNKIHEKFDGFNYKNYGYNQFSKFISAISGVTVTKRENKKYVKLAKGKKQASPKSTAKVSAPETEKKEVTPVKETSEEIIAPLFKYEEKAQEKAEEQAVDARTETPSDTVSETPADAEDTPAGEPIIKGQIARRIFTRYLDK